MQQIKDATGRFAWRPYYADGELDDLCEATITAYMAGRGGLALPIATDRLTALIERDAAELDLYADLSADGDDVEGVTEFQPREKPLVRIKESLSSIHWQENRLRTTLAHEYGHVLLHNAPYQEKVACLSLFDEAPREIIKCKRDNIFNASASDWIEWQASYACGAFLMPKSHVLASYAKFCDHYNCHYRIVAGTGWPDQLAEHIAKEFQVSVPAARIRTLKLGLVRSESPQPKII